MGKHIRTFNELNESAEHLDTAKAKSTCWGINVDENDHWFVVDLTDMDEDEREDLVGDNIYPTEEIAQSEADRANYNKGWEYHQGEVGH